jgi:parallel beta-helix repeat protein
MHTWTPLLLTAALAMPVAADTLKVPAQFASPAAALVAAQPGDRILVEGGSWGELVLLGLQPLPSGLEIVGKGKPTFTTIIVDGMTDLTLRGLKLAGGDGIDVQGATGLLIERCRVEDALWGLTVESSSSVTLRRNLILGGEIGIYLLGVDGSTLFGNKVRGATEWGILVAGDGNAIDKNRVELSGPVGVPADEMGSGNAFTRNEVIRSLGNGIELGGFGNVAAANTIKRSAAHGILVTGTGGHGASTNKIQKAGDDGIKVRDPDPAEITFDAINNSLVGNRIVGSAKDGIDCENPQNTIEGNRVRGAGDNGFEFGPQGSDNSVTANRARGSGLFDLFDDAGGNTYLDNVFRRVDPDGAQP